MNLTPSSIDPYIAVAADGEPIAPLTFNVIGLVSDDVKEITENGYTLEIVIKRTGGAGAWKSSDAFDTRKNWQSYVIPVATASNGQPKNPIAVDARWWRDVARTLGPNQTIAVTCELGWEGGTNESTVGVTLRSALDNLLLTRVSACNNNDSPLGLNGFSHHQQISIHRHGNGAYGIFQWVRGVFVHWTNTGIDKLEGAARQKAYRYPLIPSGGFDVPGYVPNYVHDGSTHDSAIPNFFNATAGLGVDMPGDAPNRPKTWDDSDRELMLMEFVVQVYLVCDLSGSPSSEEKKFDDPWDKSVNGRTNYKLRNSELSGTPELPVLAAGTWSTGILQVKTASGATGHEVIVTGGILSKAIGVDMPATITTLIRAIYGTTAKTPKVATE